MSINPLACSAMSYLRDREAQYLSHDMQRLVNLCVEHLVETCNVSQANANQAAMQALGELSARHSKVRIDCSRTTSFTLFMTDEDGNPLILLAADLARLAKLATRTLTE